MRSQLKWLVLAMLFAGYWVPAFAGPPDSSPRTVLEVHAAQDVNCPSARTSIFDARQFLRRAVDDARLIPCLSPDLQPAIFSSATAAPDGDADPTVATQTLLTLRVRLQP